MTTPKLLPLLWLFHTNLPAFGAEGKSGPIPVNRGADVLIVGDSYSAGQVGPYFEQKLVAQGHKVGRYGISASWIKSWVEHSPNEKTVGPGVGVDWYAPGLGNVGGPAPADFPRLAEIIKGEAKNVRKIIISHGTNGLCVASNYAEATKLAEQATKTVPGVQCVWLGPKLFSDKNQDNCMGDLEKEKAYSRQLGQAVEAGGCRYVDSTGLAPPGTHPHAKNNGDHADEWMKAAWPKVQ